jgi:UDP-N-acetylglucosamine transferase subunit ALG13
MERTPCPLWFESRVRRVGFVILVVVSTGHFDPLIRECARLSHQFNFLGQIGSGSFIPPFRHFRTVDPEGLKAHMLEAELVVSHAGTGMLSMLYQLKKSCVVIPKQIRYGESNDGQVELARKWGELGAGVLCMDVTELEAAIQRCRSSPPRFPLFPRLGERLRTELAESPRSGLEYRK